MLTKLRPPHFRIGVLAGCLWLGGAPLTAYAQAVGPSTRETARSLMDEGEQLRAAGDLRAALVRFKAAHALLHVPTTGLQLARAHRGLGEYVEARGVALEASHRRPTPDEPPVFAEARQEAAKLAEELAPKIPSLEVKVLPGEATVLLRVDGVSLPEAARALPLKTNPGDHEVVIEASGFKPERRLVTLADGQALVLHVQLTLDPNAVPPSPIASDAPDVSPRRAAFGAAAVNTNPEDATADAKRTRAYIGLGAGGVVLLTGVVTGVVSAIKTSTLKDRCQDERCGPATRDAMARANTFANVSNVTIPLGLVGIGYGLYELLTLPAGEKRAEKQSALQLEWDGTMASVRGSL
jgi:hypothetical protein